MVGERSEPDVQIGKDYDFEHKRAEDALRESDERFRLFASAVNDVIYRYDPMNNKYDFISPSFELQTGYTLEEIKKDPSGVTRKLTHPNDADRVLREVDEHIKKGPGAEPFQTEYRVVRKDKQIIWVSDSKTVEFTSEGKLYRINGVIRDITRRKRAEEALFESKERFRQLAENIQEAFWLRDWVNKKVLYISPAYEMIWGCSCQSLLNDSESWSETIHPDDKDRVVASFKDNAPIGKYDEIYRIVRDDGSIRWIHDRAFPIHDEDKGVWRVAGLSEDITKLKKVEAELQKSKDKLEKRVEERTEELVRANEKLLKEIAERKDAEEALIESDKRLKFSMETGNLGMFDWRIRLGEVFLSPQYYKMLGYDVDEKPVSEEWWFDLIHPDDQERIIEKSRDLVHTRKEVDGMEFRLLKKNGEVCWVWARARAIERDEEGRPLRLVGIHADITEYKRAEEEVKRKAENLKAINELAIELAAASPEVDLYELVAEKLKEITGAFATVVTTNDPKDKVLVVKYVALPKRTLLKVDKILKRKLIGMRLPLSPEILEEMFARVVERFEDLSVMTFGEIPKPVAFAIQKLLGIGDLTALVLQYGGELVGTAAILMPKGRASLPLDVARTFAHVAAVALRRKQAEEALRESEEKYRSFVERANDGIAIIQDLELKYVNPRLAEMIGYTVEELSGSRATNYVHPDDLHRLLDFYRRRMSGEETPSVYETAILAKDGSRIEVEVNVGTINYQGSLASLVFYRDITERKQAEQELRIKDSAIESSISGVALTDLKGNLTYINDSCLRMWGYDDRREALGKPAAEFYENRHSIIKIMKVLRDKGSWVGEMVGVRKDGSTFPVHLSVNMVREERGKPLCTMSSFVDISELKEAEEQIKASLAEKEVMLKEIHHRVKNNLQVISSLLKLQTEHTRDAQVVESLRASRDRIKSIALIHEKLYQSKDLAKVDFAKYIKDLMHSLFRSYGVSPEDIKLRIDIGDVYLDIDQAIPCALIINELVANCLEHAFPNASKGEIHLEFVSVPGGGFRLMVSDNGIGLPEGFDPVTAETLGLKLVETLVAQLKGKIEFNSRDGATFNITFPRITPSAQEVE